MHHPVKQGDRLHLEVETETGEIFTAIVEVVDNNDGGLDWIENEENEAIRVARHERPTFNQIG